MKKAPTAQRKQFRPTFIKAWRKRAGMTQEELAEEIGLGPTAISYLERGQSAYTQETLEAIATALDTTVVALLTRAPDEGEDMLEIWSGADEAERRQIRGIVRGLRNADAD